MNLKSCTEAGENRRKLEVEIGAEEFEAACQKAYRKAVGKISVPGFRKGKAPRNTIERMYGKEFFYEDAINIIAPDALDEAIKESGIDYLDDKIDFDVVSVGEEGLTFTAVVSVMPTVKLPNYAGIKATRPSDAVSDEDVQKELENIQQKNARTVDIDSRPAEKGDTATFDFEGFVDDVPFEGGKAENYKLELGSGNFIPGFEDQMIGHSVGEEFDVNVTFPEEYHAEELAGKPAVFKIKLHALQAKELLPLDDDFAKDFSDFDTLDEYKADIRKGLEEKAKENADSAVEAKILDWLVDEVEVIVPDVLVEKRIDQSINDMAYRMQAQGISFDDYMKYTGSDIDSVREQFRETAERQVRMRFALNYIVKDAGIEISDEDVEAELTKLAERYGMEVDSVRKAINTEDLRSDLAVEKALALVKEKAEISAE